MKAKLKPINVSATGVMSGIMKYGAKILFLAAVAVMTYLSFVDNFSFDFAAKDVWKQIVPTLITLTLNFLVWDSFYKSCYDTAMDDDAANVDYSIHRRYYEARKGWEYDALQARIRVFNKQFQQAWLADISDITGRSIESMEQDGYRGHSHKRYIWRVKHKKYPKSGIRIPRDVLQVLAVSKSGGMAINIKAAERQRGFASVKKLLMLAASAFLTVNVIMEFIDFAGDPSKLKAALLRVLMYVVTLFMSWFFGSVSGTKGGKLKLSTAEEVAERLEEWKNMPPSEEPYRAIATKLAEDIPQEPEKPAEPERVTIELL